MKIKFFLFISLSVMLFFNIVLCAEQIKIKFNNQRHSFYRNEEITFIATVTNTTKSQLNKLHIMAAIHPTQPFITKKPDFSGYTYTAKSLTPLPSVMETINLKKGEDYSIKFPLKSSLLKEGEYYLEIIVKVKKSIIKSRYDIYISQRPIAQRFPVFLWGNNAHLMDWAVKHGFNEMQIGDIEWPLTEVDSTVSIYKRLFEEGIKKKVDVGMYFWTFNPKRYKDHPEVNATHRKTMGKQKIDGMWTEEICLREPYVITYSEKITESAMNLFKKYPSLSDVLINSEYIAIPCFSDNCVNLMKKETGLDLYDYNVNPLKPPKTEAEVKELKLPEKFLKTIPVNGIIENDNPFYKYYMWWWKKGLGDVPLNKKIAKVINDIRPDVMTWNDPLRLAPVYGRKEGLEGISTWIYTHPDPKYMGYIELMITEAKPKHKKIIPSVTLWEYQNWLAPTDSGTVMIPVDIFRENNWLALSYRPDALLNYIPSPLLPTEDIDSFHRNVGVFEAMKSLSDNVYKPYGAFILKMKRTPRKVAMLISAASVLYGKLDRGEWPNKSIFPFYSLLMMAHIPTDVIFDETITEYGLDDYDVLILHQAEVLTQSVYNKIMEFKKRGGIVIADKYLGADIPVDHIIKFNLDHRKKQLADLTVKGEGVTADEDRVLMTKYSKEIRDNIGNKISRYIDSPSSEVVFNVLENGPVKYIFMVNDKRTYGGRFARWQTMHTKGVEQTVEARLNYNEKKAPVVYDVRKHSIVPLRYENGVYKFSRILGPADGTILSVYPAEISKVEIEVPAAIKRGQKGTITISVKDINGDCYGTQPLYIRVTALGDFETGYSGYYATDKGQFSLDIVPALNDLAGTWKIKVTDLTSGLNRAKDFKVE